MTKLNKGGKLPNKFKIANQEITVVMEDSLPNNDYGYFCDATNTIKLARTINSEHDGEVILSDEQVRNTFITNYSTCFNFTLIMSLTKHKLRCMLTLCVNL